VLFSCLAALVGGGALACSSEEKPPSSRSYNDDTTTAPSTPFRDLRGDGNDEAATPTETSRARANPDSDRLQEGPPGIRNEPPRSTGDAGVGSDEGSDAGADAADAS
jgi:hypothetical protein